MLHLKPRVHLDEIGARFAGDELDGARAHIADGRRGLARRLVQRFAALIVKGGGRRFLDHFLMAPLQRAFALEQRNHAAMRVAEDLHFDMARALDEFLDKQPAVAEGGRRLALRARNRGVQLFEAPHHAHAFAAAAGHRFQQHRKAKPLRFAREGGGVLLLAAITRHNRHARFFHQRFGCGFRAHGADRGCGRAYENKPRRLAGFGKLRLLGQKAVTGVNGLSAAGLRRRDDRARC